MLILTRRISESVFIIHPDGTLIDIRILGMAGNQVRIGVGAPKNLLVYRAEVMRRILDENNGKIPGTLYSEDQNFNKN